MVRNLLAATAAVAVASLLGSILGAFFLAAPALAAPADGPVAAPVAAPVAQAAPKAPAKKAEGWKPPKYDLLRFKEDYRPLLCVPTCDRCDVFDRAKALRLSSCAWVDFGGQVRLRYEQWENQNFGGVTPGPDDGWLLTRVRAYGDLHLDPAFRVFVEGIYADQEEREAGPRPIDENHGDFLNAFAEVHGGIGRGWKGGFRVGREELLFGKQRVIGPLDWANTCRTFDVVHGWVENASWRVDGFWSRPVVVEVDDLDEWYFDATDFGGVYGRFSGCKGYSIEPYALYLHRDAATFLGVTGEEDRWTVGCLATGPLFGSKRLDFDVEGAWQFGTFADGDIMAGMFTAEAGWKPCVKCLEPRIALGFDWASGDDDGPGGDLGTYNQLFPTGHLWFGWADLIGRQNLIAGRVTVTANLLPKLTARVDFHTFWRATTDDAAYNAAGGVLRAPLGSTERHIAEEIDVQLKWAVQRHVDVEVGYAHVFSGTFLDETGAHEDVDFLYGSVTFTF